MGLDIEIRFFIKCPYCGTDNKIQDFATLWRRRDPDIWRYEQTDYGDDYVYRCHKCGRQLIRVRVSY